MSKKEIEKAIKFAKGEGDEETIVKPADEEQLKQKSQPVEDQHSQPKQQKKEENLEEKTEDVEVSENQEKEEQYKPNGNYKQEEYEVNKPKEEEKKVIEDKPTPAAEAQENTSLRQCTSQNQKQKNEKQKRNFSLNKLNQKVYNQPKSNFFYATILRRIEIRS